uniref:Receptor ligand binding region domain-containing protein n=1 Tax=Panagrolaimus sp. ES5 TaxID=591445 RepID=A0AC34F461_9BILA
MILRYHRNLIVIIVIIILENTLKINSKAWRLHGSGNNNRHSEIWPLAISESEIGLSDLEDNISGENSDGLISDDLNTIAPAPVATDTTINDGSGDEDELSAFNLERRSRSLGEKKYFKYEVSKEKPIYVLFPLPKEKGIPEHNPFGITIDLVKPVVDEALAEVYRRELIPEGVLKINFENTQLSDAHGPNVAIHALVKNQLDCIIGYAFVYALAPVARMSPHWEDDNSHGIPIITSIGLTANLDNRKEYQLMTRISSPYKVIKDAVLALFNKVKWKRTVYLFHDRRHGMTSPDIPYGECYLMMASLEPYLSRLHRMEHNYFMFNELHHNRIQIQEHLKKASTMSNVVKMGQT